MQLDDRLELHSRLEVFHTHRLADAFDCSSMPTTPYYAVLCLGWDA